MSEEIEGSQEPVKKPPVKRKRSPAQKTAARKRAPRVRPTVQDDLAAGKTFIGKVGVRLKGWWQYKAFRIGVAVAATLLLLFVLFRYVEHRIDKRVEGEVEAYKQAERNSYILYLDSMQRVQDSLGEVRSRDKIQLNDINTLDSLQRMEDQKKNKSGSRSSNR